MHITQAFCYLLSASLALAATWAGPALAAETTAAPPAKEYFVNQQAGEALLIKLESFEAEIESRVYGPQKSLLAVSQLTGNRIAPLFQFIGPDDSARQLDIEVRAGRRTGNSKFEIEFTRLKAWDERSNLVMRAYLLLSYSMLEPQRAGKAAWSDRVSALISAGKLFARFGMQEQRLWSSYLAAYLAYHRLGDAKFAAELNDKVLAEVHDSRWQQIELAALQLKAAILVDQRRTGSLESAGANDDRVQTTLFTAARLAQSMGYGYQHAQALFTSGLDYAEQSRFPQALAQYQNALRAAEPLGDEQLLNDIRERIVAANTKLGNASASGQVLRQMETHLLRQGNGDELALNLLQQGELAMQGHRYPEARKILAQALEHQNDSSIRSRANFALAQASFEMGDEDAALAHLEAAGVSSRVRPSGLGGGVIDMAAGLGMMAAIQRARGDYQAMLEARTAQLAWLGSAAEKSGFYYQQGLDALARGGRERTRASVYFRRSYRAAAAAGLGAQASLAQLQMCALQLGTAEPCSAASSAKAYRALVSAAIPRQSAAAAWLRARYLARHGDLRQAAQLLQQLVADIHFYRQRLPGVLGSWYWQWHEQTFADYLDVAGRAPVEPASRDSRDFESLLALTRVRWASRPPAEPPVSGAEQEPMQVRNRLAKIEAAKDGTLPAGLDAGLRQQLAELRHEFDARHAFLSPAGLRATLATLSAREAVLSYHVEAGEAQAWLATNGYVQRFHIDHPERLYAGLQKAWDDFQHGPESDFEVTMQALGEQLLRPLTGQLPETVYVVADGLLSGFPIDALKWDQHYLAEQHRVINLLAFPAIRNPGAALKMPFPERVFLAGYPQDYSGRVETSLETSGEIRAVADLFVGPGLQIVQGGALLRDEFRGDGVRRAELLHLSMPAVIDLAEPDHSSLTLSEPESGAGRETLAPGDVTAVPLEAGLVFLSATTMQGEAREAFATQPGLVSDYLAAGAGAVIAGAWRPGTDSAVSLVTGFYKALAANGDIAAALAQSKREYLQQHQHQAPADWAAYQLYIR